mgnify:CR=1 FL=1
MKKIFLPVIVSLAFIFNSFSQELSEAKGGGTLDIILISLNMKSLLAPETLTKLEPNHNHPQGPLNEVSG